MQHLHKILLYQPVLHLTFLLSPRIREKNKDSIEFTVSKDLIQGFGVAQNAEQILMAQALGLLGELDDALECNIDANECGIGVVSSHF